MASEENVGRNMVSKENFRRGVWHRTTTQERSMAPDDDTREECADEIVFITI